MLLPIGTERPLKRPTLVNHVLIVANALIFVVMAGIAASDKGEQVEQFTRNFWLDPRAFTFWGIVTYQFLHGGFMHVAGNMLFLWVFGPNVEDRLGRIGYLAFYLVGGMAAGGLHMAFEMNPVVGASGSISAVTGAYLVFFPKTHIKTLVFFFIIGVFWIPAAWLITFAIVKDVVFQGMGGADGVARLAHIGGYVFGAGVAITLLWTHVLPREAYDLFSIGRQAKRRRSFKELTSKGHSPWAHSPSNAVRGKKSAPENPALTEARSKIATALGETNVNEAIEAYKDLVGIVDKPLLPRQNQIDIANHLFQAGEHSTAATAYQIFLATYKADNEAPRVRLMLGLLYSRYLDEPDRARPLLERAAKEVHEASQKELAQSLLKEIT